MMQLLTKMATDPREVIPESLTIRSDRDEPHFFSCPSLEGLCFASKGVENVYMLVWCAPVQRILELNGLNLILNFHWNLRYQNQTRFATFYYFFFHAWPGRLFLVHTSLSVKQLG